MAPQARLELATLRLTAGCSTIELLRSVSEKSAPGGARDRADTFIYQCARSGQSRGHAARSVALRADLVILSFAWWMRGAYVACGLCHDFSCQHVRSGGGAN